MDYDSNDDEAARVSLKGELRIQAADACAEFISECNLPRRHTVGDMGYEVTSHAVHPSIPNELKNQIFDIFEVNMREYYEQNWGWDKEMKWSEMFSDKSHYLLLRDPESGKVVAFSHFQFVWDDEDEPEEPVVYCFELHVAVTEQGRGLGKFMMSLLTMTAKHFNFAKLMLTVFQSNKPAFNFYRHIGFEVDAQDPSNFGMFEEDYFIMSRKC